MPQDSPARNPGVATWVGFGLMGVGMFMAILDVQVVATSLPTIQDALKVAPEQMSWIQTAYLIAEVIAIPLTGFLTRVLSMRWLFVCAITVFTLASTGCAASHGFSELIAWRVLQGFSGGTLIPAVFSAVFLLFPPRLEALATTIAGVLAVLAPTVGPIVGGWITQTYSWHWLFLINLAPGIVSGIGAAILLPREPADPREALTLDLLSLVLMATALAGLEIALKQAPQHGWLSPLVIGLLALTVVTLTLFIRRSLGAATPVVTLSHLADRNFAIGCILSFLLGVGLFGSVYMMPVFLALVRGHGALEIGQIMLVTGVAQLATAPIAVALERRIDPRILAAAGFLLFGIGLAMSTHQTEDTDFHAMIAPQIVRGVAIMFCLLPPTRLALGYLPLTDVPDASGLFNLMRNLGGAIGLALIDTVIYGRSPFHAKAITAKLESGDLATAQAVGLPTDLFLSHHGPVDEFTRSMIAPMVEKLALVRSINEAWLLVAALTFCALIALPFARARREDGAG